MQQRCLKVTHTTTSKHTCKLSHFSYIPDFPRHAMLHWLFQIISEFPNNRKLTVWNYPSIPQNDLLEFCQYIGDKIEFWLIEYVNKWKENLWEGSRETDLQIAEQKIILFETSWLLFFFSLINILQDNFNNSKCLRNPKVLRLVENWIKPTTPRRHQTIFFL